MSVVEKEIERVDSLQERLVYVRISQSRQKMFGSSSTTLSVMISIMELLRGDSLDEILRNTKVQESRVGTVESSEANGKIWTGTLIQRRKRTSYGITVPAQV